MDSNEEGSRDISIDIENNQGCAIRLWFEMEVIPVCGPEQNGNLLD